MRTTAHCPGVSGRLEKCGRWAPAPVVLGTIYVLGDPTPRLFLGLRQCSRCEKAEKLADKRRAVLQSNLRKAYGD